jgi:hypothetical protein
MIIYLIRCPICKSKQQTMKEIDNCWNCNKKIISKDNLIKEIKIETKKTK